MIRRKSVLRVACSRLARRKVSNFGFDPPAAICPLELYAVRLAHAEAGGHSEETPRARSRSVKATGARTFCVQRRATLPEG
jgi:hypothetical protein